MGKKLKLVESIETDGFWEWWSNFPRKDILVKRPVFEEMYSYGCFLTEV